MYVCVFKVFIMEVELRRKDNGSFNLCGEEMRVIVWWLEMGGQSRGETRGES
jgi:hypothetical protein